MREKTWHIRLWSLNTVSATYLNKKYVPCATNSNSKNKIFEDSSFNIHIDGSQYRHFYAKSSSVSIPKRSATSVSFCKWAACIIRYAPLLFGLVGVKEEIAVEYRDKTRLDLFKLFVNENLMLLMVEKTNRYVRQLVMSGNVCRSFASKFDNILLQKNC